MKGLVLFGAIVVKNSKNLKLWGIEDRRSYYFNELLDCVSAQRNTDISCSHGAMWLRLEPENINT